jgi:hypothetical protein
MTDHVTNRLLFLSNAKTILAFIKSRPFQGDVPPQFSLNSVWPMPPALVLPLTEGVRRLSLMNIEMPKLNEAVQKAALTKVFFGRTEKAQVSEVTKTIEQMHNILAKTESKQGRKPLQDSEKTALEVFDQAVANYEEFKCFCQYDWRLTHWGTPDDIHSVVPSTFELPTTCIEFQTRWTPPIAAMRYLAQTFPSVRFELTYRCHPDDLWTKVEIFPITPFGY